MGSEIQTRSGLESPIDDPFGGSAHANFLDALDSEINRIEKGDEAKEIEVERAHLTSQQDEIALKDVESALNMFLANSFSSAFEDRNKLEFIKDFIVHGMGVRSQDDMVKILPRMLEHAEQVTKMKMSSLDKLFYLIMNQKNLLQSRNP